MPASLARWRSLVAEGLSFFLERLEPARRSAILAAQLALPPGSGAGPRLFALMTQCPTLHKLGQVIARHRGIPEAVRASLRELESMPASTPIDEVLASIRAELPRDARLGIAGEALAEASVAVVVPFTWEEGGILQHGVFKVLKPGIETKLREELEIWLALGDFLERRGRELGLPALEFRDTLDSVAELLANEVRLDVEQANLAAAAAFHANTPGVVVPRLLRWCTPRMTAMQRVFGTKVTDAGLTLPERRRAADTLISALVALPFWSDSADAIVHADPHAGNLFATDDGQLAVLDWALVARLSKNQRENIVDAALGGLTLDASRVCRAVAALGSLAPDDPGLREAVEVALQRVRRFELPGFDWLITLLDEIAIAGDAGFRKDLVLFRKAWATLSGVLHDLAGGQSPDRVLVAVALERFAAELPERFTAAPGSRAFGTHVSNADLIGMWTRLALAPSRFWLGAAHDVWAARFEHARF